MSVPNRSQLINTTYEVLKKHYKPVKPPADRSLLEHLLYACCLENAQHEAADEAFAKLQQVFFDWNEIRVTTVTELAETMSSLPDPSAAAARLKRCLQSIFETHYAFDIEFMRKQNLGKSVKELKDVDGTTSFGVAYVAQNGLGGHSIPTNKGVIHAMEVVGVISAAEAKKHRVPGLERAIPKANGVEFASLIHQLGADFFAAPFGSRIRSILVEISPDAKARLPKRTTKKKRATDQADEVSTRKGSRKRGAAKASTRGATRSKKGSKRKRADAAAEGKKPARRKSKKTKAAPAVKKSPTKQLSRKKPR